MYPVRLVYNSIIGPPEKFQNKISALNGTVTVINSTQNGTQV